MGIRGKGVLADKMIDPRLLVTQEAFDALPWREQFLRMRRYVDAIVPAIIDRCNPVNFSDGHVENAEALADWH